MGNAVRLSCLVTALAASHPLAAIEKHWVAHQVELILVGTLKQQIPFPWLDGWRVSGTITVDEVLFGTVRPHRIQFRLLCKWEWTRPPGNPPSPSPTWDFAISPRKPTGRTTFAGTNGNPALDWETKEGPHP